MQLRKRDGIRGPTWTIDYMDRSGKRQRYTLKGIATEKHAELAFADFRLKYERQELNLPTDEKITLESVLTHRCEERQLAGCSERWVKRLESMREHPYKFFGKDKPFKSVTDDELARYRNQRLKENAAVETVNKELKLLIAAGRLAVRQGKIARLPWSKVNFAIDRTGKEAWSYMKEDEIAKLLNLLRHGGKVSMTRKNNRPLTFTFNPKLDLWATVTFLLNTGSRKGEMFALRWNDLDLNAKTVRLVGSKSAKNGKSAKSRYIPMNTALEDLFAILPKGGAKDPVFKFDWNLHHRFTHALKCAGLPHYRIHDARHTFCSHLAMRGVPLYTIARLVGHSTVEMTQRYAHLAPESLANAVQSLNFAPRSEATPEASEGKQDRDVGSSSKERGEVA